MNTQALKVKSLTLRVKAMQETYENSADVSGVTATADYVAEGKTFVDKNKNLVTGTLLDGSAVRF